MLCAVSILCSYRLRSAVADLVLFVSSGRSFRPACLRYAAFECVVQEGCDRRKIRSLVDCSELVGGKVRRSIVQVIAWRDVASVESKIIPILHPKTRRTR